MPLAKGVRGLVTRAPGQVQIDGNVDEWSEAFCTPVHYNHGNLTNRAAQFFYLWDDEALYIGLRCLDQKQANPGHWTATSITATRSSSTSTPGSGEALRGKDWSDGRGPLVLLALRRHGGQAPLGDAGRGSPRATPCSKGSRSRRSTMAGATKSNSSCPGPTSPASPPSSARSWPSTPSFAAATARAGPTERSLTARPSRSSSRPRSARSSWSRRSTPTICQCVGPRVVPVLGRDTLDPARAGRTGGGRHSSRIRRRRPARSRSGCTTPTARSSKPCPLRIEPFGPAGNEVRAGRRHVVDRRRSPRTPISRPRNVLAMTGKTLTTVAPRMVQEAQHVGPLRGCGSL